MKMKQIVIKNKNLILPGDKDSSLRCATFGMTGASWVIGGGKQRRSAGFFFSNE